MRNRSNGPRLALLTTDRSAAEGFARMCMNLLRKSMPPEAVIDMVQSVEHPKQRLEIEAAFGRLFLEELKERIK